MAPSRYKKKSSRRPRTERRSDTFTDGTPAKRRRVELDVIDGVGIFSFENELELDYFTNIEEPLPRRIHAFLGFEEDDNDDLKLIKSSFDRFIKGNNENVLKTDHTKRVEAPQCAPTSTSATYHVADDLIILSDDESTSEPTAVSHVITAKPVDDESVQIVIEPTEVITIDSDDDSDDDVVMVSDPNAPLPQPVRDCVCPNCGKVKRTDQNRRITESDKDSGVDDVSVITEEVAIITDEDVPAPVRSKTSPLQPKDLLPEEIRAQSADIREELLSQPAEVLTEDVPSPAAAEILTEEVPSPAAAEPLSASSSRSPLKVNYAFSLADQQSPYPLSSSHPQHISTKPSSNKSPNVQKSSSQLKPPATVPQTLRVVSKESGKTFFLKVNEAKSKILKPSATPSNLCNSSKHPQSFHYLLPGEKPCGMSSSEAKTVKRILGSPPKSVVGPRTVEVVKVQPPNLSLKPVIGPRAVEVVKVQPPNLSPKPVVGPRTVEVRKIQQPNKVTHKQQQPPMSVLGPRTVGVGKVQQPDRSPKSVGPRKVEVVKVQQPNLAPKSVVRPRTVDVGKIQQKNLTPTSVVGQTTEVGRIEQPNGVPHTYRITIPPNTIRVNLTPGFSDKNKVIKAQPINGAKGQVQVRNAGVTKPGVVVALGSTPQAGMVIVSPQSQVKHKIVADAQMTNAGVASDFSVLKLARSNETNDSAVLESPMSHNTKIESLITEASFEPEVLEDDTKSVVKDLIDFVCRQENFPTSYPYDQGRTEQFSLDVPCRQVRCRMGCICVSLSKKNVRRVRCRNADCIFGCICMSHGVVVPANRHSKTVPNMKLLGISRRKQVLTVLPDCDDDCNRIGVQPALKSFLPVQKVVGVSRRISVSHGPNPDIRLQGSGSTSHPASNGSSARNVPGVLRTGRLHGSSINQASTPRSSLPGSIQQGSGFSSSARPASKGLQIVPEVPVPKTGVTSSQRRRPTSDLAPANELLVSPGTPKTSQDHPAQRLSVPVAQPRSFFGREKTPIPERALMCLTPGFGYVPLGEIHPTVTLDSPFKPGSSKSFLGVRQATEWLNSKLEIYLNTKMPPNLRWVVADGQTIEKKQQHRLSIDLLSSPNCTISRNGAVFSS